jgi:adenylyltransferase/sulfurtransferase
MASISALELFTRLNDGEVVNLLDVREVLEYCTYNIGGQNMPLSTFRENLNRLHYNKSDEIIVICKVGLRSQTATQILTENGYQQARNLTGGLMALRKLK